MEFLIENASFLQINMFLYLDVKVFVHVIEILLQYGCNFGNIFFMSSDLQNNYPKIFYTFANLLIFKIFKLESN